MQHEIVLKLNHHIAKGFKDDADVVYLLVQFGKLMELTGCEKDYPVLKFYRDWVVHARITRSEVGGTVLQRVADIIDELKQAHTDTLLRALTDALSLDTTRQQLVALAARVGVNPDSFGEREWRTLVPVLTEIISNIPLTIDPEKPSKKLKAILEKIRAKPLKDTWVIQQLALVKVPTARFKPTAPAEEITFCIEITSRDGPTIIAPLLK
jgi:hypothetical protein